jgi:long-subunit acyl-CoA synthetase (AMP-forming)
MITTQPAVTTGLKGPLEYFHIWEASRPDQVFLNQPLPGGRKTWTWKQAGLEIRKLAAAIQALNLPAGSRIGLVSKNCAHWIMTDLAIMMSGHVSVPVYPNVGASTLAYVLDHSEARLLFVGKLDDWDSMKSGVPDGLPVISFPEYGPEGYTSWEAFTADVSPIEGQVSRHLDDMMTIIYTSGTTGEPKGVVHPFRSLAFAIENADHEIDLGGNNVRLFSYLPLSHIAERMLVEMGSLLKGAEVFFAQSLDTFAEDLRFAKPTTFLGVPRIWTKFQMGIIQKLGSQKLNFLLSIPIINNVIRKKVKEGLGLDQTVSFLTGAAPTPPSVMHFFNKLHIPLQEVYAMTENSAYSHFNRRDNIRIGFGGQPMPGVEVKISEIGEVLVKSEATMTGYYKEPELTAQTLKNGFLHTGDQGEVDTLGFLKITGRVKDTFKSSKGKFIVPNPIELALSDNSFVEQVCIVGFNIPQPIALVVLSENALKTDFETIDHSLENTLNTVNQALEKHEKLSKIVLVKEEWTVENEILTPTMKVKRNAIDKHYGHHYEDWYSMPGKIVRE